MIVPQLQDFFERLSQFPWRNTARTLRQRFREDRLGQTAGSLTFTTTIALVPLVTVALAVFTAFPIFSDFQTILQRRLVESLVPDNISRQVLGYLTQFASQASRLGVVGVTALFLSAVALVFTIDRTLNNIWRVRQPRPFAQRVLIYWSAVTLGPLLLKIGDHEFHANGLCARGQHRQGLRMCVSVNEEPAYAFGALTNGQCHRFSNCSWFI